jgi:hypothetical protein
VTVSGPVVAPVYADKSTATVASAASAGMIAHFLLAVIAIR